MKLPKLLSAPLALAMLLISATAFGESLGFSLKDHPGASAPQVVVLDDSTLQPLADANVQISTSTPTTITVTHPGFASVVLAGVAHQDVTIFLKPLPASLRGDVIVTGTMGDYHVPEDPDHVRAGLVFRALSVFDLLHFDLSAVVSPISDTIDVFGKRKIPSNLVLPDQTIPVMFTSVEVNKPTYRLPMLPSYQTHLVGMQVDINTDDLINMVQNGGGGAIAAPANVNKLRFDRVGISDLMTASDGLRQDVPATQDLKDAYQVTVTAPPFKADVAVAAVTDLDGDREQLFPTDLKFANVSSHHRRAAVSLRTTEQPMGKARGLLAIAMTPKAKQLSGVIQDEAGANVSIGAFLNAAVLPDFQGLPSTVSIQAGDKSVATAIFESTYTEPTTGKARSFPVGYAYSLPSAGTVTVPALVADGAHADSYSVMQLEFGTLNEEAIDGQTILRDIRRFTRSVAGKTAK